MVGETPFDITQEARTVVVVAMSARSGSSWLVEQLKQSTDFVHFRGELTTFLRLHGLTRLDGEEISEALTSSDARKADDAFREHLTQEAGYPLDHIDDPERFAGDILRRLPLQWPDIDFGEAAAEIVRQAVFQAAGAADAFDAVIFTERLLGTLAEVLPLDPAYHDFGREPGPASDRSYPFRYMLESPPFLLFSPWRPASLDDVRRKPLIIKSAGDVYRLDFYRSLFPNAQVRVLHLRRNPAASINGLMNAWLSRKYQSFRVGNLSIDGYSELAPWRREWWKLDLAPGWEGYRKASLPEVCEWQWRRAQDAVLNWCASNDQTPFVARYEDMVASAESRLSLIGDLCSWLGVPVFLPSETRLMNASTVPQKRAWMTREAQILPLIETEACRSTSARLGYGDRYMDWI